MVTVVGRAECCAHCKAPVNTAPSVALFATLHRLDGSGDLAVIRLQGSRAPLDEANAERLVTRAQRCQWGTHNTRSLALSSAGGESRTYCKMCECTHKLAFANLGAHSILPCGAFRVPVHCVL